MVHCDRGTNHHMTMLSDVELRETYSNIESFHKESLSLEINPIYLPQAVLAQCTVSYHKFVEQMVKSFGPSILNQSIDATVEILYRSNKNQTLPGLIKFGCSNLKFAVNSVKLALRRSSHDSMLGLIKFNNSKTRYTIIRYVLPGNNDMVKHNHNSKIFKFGESINARASGFN